MVVLQFGSAAPDGYFYGSFIRDSGKSLIQWALKPGLFEYPDSVYFAMPSLVADLEILVGQFAARVFLKEFYEHGSWDLECSHENYLKMMSSLLHPDWISYLTTKYKVLNFVKYIIADEINFFNLFYKRFSKDESLLGRFLSRSKLVLKDVCRVGDRHENGSALRLEFTNGDYLIYKPQSAANYQTIKELIQESLPSTVFNVDVPDFIDCEHYHWERYIEASNFNDEGSTYRLGALLALCNVLGLRDIHQENVMHSNNCTYLIDVECIAMPPIKLFEDSVPGVELTDIGILPHYMNYLGLEKPFDVSPFGILQHDENINGHGVHRIVDDGLPTVRLTNEITKPAHELNSSQKLSINVSEFERGYIEARHYLTNLNATKVIKLLRKNDVRSRVILRHTQFYANCLRRATYPAHMVDIPSYKKALKNWLSNSSSFISQDAVDLEMEALIRQQIPSFYVTISQNNLHNMNIFSCEEIIEAQFRDVLKTGSLVKGKRTIRQSFAVKIQDCSELPIVSKSSAITIVKGETPDLRKTLSSISQSIVECAKSKGNFFYWDNLIKDNQGRMIIHADPFSLYNGSSGTFLALTAADNILKLKNENLHTLLEALNDTFTDHIFSLDTMEKPVLGFYTGAAGVLYSLLFSRQSCLEKELITAFAETVVKQSDFSGHDVISGAAGILGLISGLRCKDVENKSLHKAELKLTEYLYDTRRYDSRNHLTWENHDDWVGGFAHGPLGVAWALARTADKEKHLQLIREAISSRESLYSPEQSKWRQSALGEDLTMSAWCHGSEGTVAPYRLFEELRIVNLENALGVDTVSSLSSATPENGSLCHGISGRVLNQTRLFGALPKNLKLTFIEYLNYMNDMSVCLSDTLMTGRSGVLYAALSLLKTDLENPLYCEIPNSRRRP